MDPNTTIWIDAVNANGHDLRKYGIYHDTQAVLKGNRQLRLHLAESDPKWENDYLDFGVGDGCGNYFFLHATDEEGDLVQLWAHDPPGIEEVSTGTEFLPHCLRNSKLDSTGLTCIDSRVMVHGTDA